MNFLAPLFLVGGLAVALPIIFHLTRRKTREVTPFSSLMFLMPTPPRVTQRNRIENWFLLLLRCLALLLLAFGFARPFVQQVMQHDSAASLGKRILILVDNSASMRREDLWKQACAKAEQRLRAASPLDQMSLATFDRNAKTIMSFDEWSQVLPDNRVETALERLAKMSPSWSGTNLGAALLQGADAVESGARELKLARQIIVISDLQEGSKLEGLQGYAWPSDLAVLVDSVAPKKAANAGLQWIVNHVPGAPNGKEGLRIRVNNSSESSQEQFQVRWMALQQNGPVDVYVPAGQSRTVQVTSPSEEKKLSPEQKLPPDGPASLGQDSVSEGNVPATAVATASQSHVAATPFSLVEASHLVLTGDSEDFDNSLYVLPPEPVRIPILLLGSSVPQSNAQWSFYLERAFQTGGYEKVEVLTRPGDQALAGHDLADARLLVTAGGLSDAAIESAKNFASEGKTILFPLMNASAGADLRKLLNLPGLSVEEAPDKDYSLLAEIDFKDVLFAAFSDPRYSDFTKIHFWHHRRLKTDTLPEAKVLARFDDGDPAFLQVPIGKGILLIWTSSWTPSDSQLALSTKFVPLIYTILDQASGIPLQKPQYFVGEPVALPVSTQSQFVRMPDGQEISVSSGEVFQETNQPGIYTILPSGRHFAVNLSPDESRVLPLSSDRLTALGVPLDRPHAETAASATNQLASANAAELESQQKLWWWLIAVALVFLLGETLLGGVIGLHSKPSTEVQT